MKEYIEGMFFMTGKTGEKMVAEGNVDNIGEGGESSSGMSLMQWKGTGGSLGTGCNQSSIRQTQRWIISI